MIDLSVLDWLVCQSSPLSQEVAVLHIDPRGSDKVITEQVIIVHQVDTDRWAARENDREVVVLAKVGVGTVKSVVIALAELLLTARNFDVRIRQATDIARGKVIGANHVDTDDAL